ncbi:MAG: DUF5989 family protein [Planctomycetes bacterium]|nr:DUF5989 family protein [Planctomycetota bacterium]
MGKFLRDNWAWIAGPILVVAVVLAVLVLFFSGDDSAPFVYNI